MRSILFIFLAGTLLLLSSCNKENIAQNSLSIYPDGITKVDLTTENDCSLPECSDKRVIRFTADNMHGNIVEDIEDNLFYIEFHRAIDTDIHYIFCDLPEAYAYDGLPIVFSGNLRDACGIYTPYVGGQAFYLIEITDIRKQ